MEDQYWTDGIEDELETNPTSAHERAGDSSYLSIDWEGATFENPPESAPIPGDARYGPRIKRERYDVEGFLDSRKRADQRSDSAYNGERGNGTSRGAARLAEAKRRFILEQLQGKSAAANTTSTTYHVEPSTGDGIGLDNGRGMGGNSNPIRGRLPGTDFDQIHLLATIKDLKVLSSGDGQFSVIVPFRWVENMLALRHGQQLILDFQITRAAGR